MSPSNIHNKVLLFVFLKCCRFSEDVGAIHVSGLHYSSYLHAALKHFITYK
jgi:hypothetical protein